MARRELLMLAFHPDGSTAARCEAWLVRIYGEILPQFGRDGVAWFEPDEDPNEELRRPLICIKLAGGSS